MLPQILPLTILTAVPLCVLIASSSKSSAATVLGSYYTVYTNVEGNGIGDISTSGPIESTQSMEFNQNHAGPIVAGATNMILTENHAGPQTFSYTAGDIDATERPAGWSSTSPSEGPFGGAAGNVIPQISEGTQPKVEAESSSTHSVLFTLGVGEVQRVNLSLNYTIEIFNGNQNEAGVAWELTGPSGAIFSDGDSRNNDVNTTLITNPVTAIINEAGSYTLTLIADVPMQTFNNEQHSASATLNGVFFEVVSVPEPGVSGLLALSLMTGLLRRRR